MSNFDSKLSSIQSYAERANEACSRLEKLIRNFVSLEILDEETIRVFALKQNELLAIKTRLENLTIISAAFRKHRDMICIKEETMAKGLQLMDKVEDELSAFIAEVKATTIFLENKLK